MLKETSALTAEKDIITTKAQGFLKRKTAPDINRNAEI